MYGQGNYSTFTIASDGQFTLTVGGYDSDVHWHVKDSLQNGAAFSTKDRDNDQDPGRACASTGGGW